jgi:signal peptidase I
MHLAPRRRRPPRRSRRRSRLAAFLRQHVFPTALLAAVFLSFRSAVADWNIVPSGSMNPTILEGDRIFVNKLAYGLHVPFTSMEVAHWSSPKRGDVVVFYSPVDGQRLVKRVIGLPGDTIELAGNRLMINRTPAEYEAVANAGDLAATLPAPQLPHAFATERVDGQSHPVMSTPALAARRNFAPLTVPPGHYFVMGDNRDNSADSRYIGFIPQENVVGRSSYVICSLDADHWPLPRWGRTLKKMP